MFSKDNAKRITRTGLMIILAHLSACATTGTDRNSNPSVIEVPKPPEQSNSGMSNTESGQITADGELRDQAIIAIDSKEYAQAGRLLERALRINSRSAANYHQFARLRDAQGLYAEALQFTEKGLTLADGTALKDTLLALRASLKEKLASPKNS